LLAWLAPMVVIFAIITSYFGTMLGAEEGTSYMVRLIAPRTANRLNRRGLLTIVYTFIFVTGTLVSVFNPPILSLIYLVGGVFDAVLIFLLPVYMFHRVKEYKTYRHDPWNYFVFFFGSVILAITIWDLF
ncbi:septum formation initiator, partial [Corynebacterium striatum]